MLVRQSLRRSRMGLSTIVAEVMMLLIVIILSAIVFAWVVPTFQANTGQDNSGAAYAEKFSTVWGNFATFAPSIPESVTPSIGPWSPNTQCTGTISSTTSSNIFVPANAVCVIKAPVGNVFVSPGANLTVVSTTINGDLVANYSMSVTLKNSVIVGCSSCSWPPAAGLYNVQLVNIIGSSINTSGNDNVCADGCDMAVYYGGRGNFIMMNTTVDGQVESEVSHIATITGNTVIGRLEVESADFGQITNNRVQVLDLDQNGVLVISGNTITGNDSYFPGPSLLYGFNRWCAAGNNVVSGGSTGICIGNIEIDIINTGSIPVNLISIYMSGIPLSGPMSWKLMSGGTVRTSLPITIPVGQSANVTMQWTPPPTLTTLPWMGVYFIFVSSHNNFVDGYVYFGNGQALTLSNQSRPQNRICPPCY